MKYNLIFIVICLVIVIIISIFAPLREAITPGELYAFELKLAQQKAQQAQQAPTPESSLTTTEMSSLVSFCQTLPTINADSPNSTALINKLQPFCQNVLNGT
jgi:hypothetical protein